MPAEVTDQVHIIPRRQKANPGLVFANHYGNIDKHPGNFDSDSSSDYDPEDNNTDDNYYTSNSNNSNGNDMSDGGFVADYMPVLDNGANDEGDNTDSNSEYAPPIDTSSDSNAVDYADAESYDGNSDNDNIESSKEDNNSSSDSSIVPSEDNSNVAEDFANVGQTWVHRMENGQAITTYNHADNHHTITFSQNSTL